MIGICVILMCSGVIHYVIIHSADFGKYGIPYIWDNPGNKPGSVLYH